MRRHLMALAAVAGMVAIAGCGGGGAGAGGTAPTSELTGRGPITFVRGKDTSGDTRKMIEEWNRQHPQETVRLIELPESADLQRQQMIQNAQTKSDAYTVLDLDVVWTAEFAANQWIEPLPQDTVPLDKFLPPAVETAKYRGRLYAVPRVSNGGLLFYRKDLLDKAGLQPPKTWAELEQACAKVLALPEAKGMSCYAGQFEKYEGLTVNFSEAVHSAGGQVIGPDGKPHVNTPQAKAGLDFLVNGFKTGLIPKEAITFKEEEGRRAFQAGKLVFHRQWPYQYAKANATDGSSQVAGKFAVAPLPGKDGPGASSLGGANLAISKFAKNKATALDFIKFMTSEERQREHLEATSDAPTLTALYDEPALQQRFPYLPVLKESILKAVPRPVVVRYGDVTAAIQDAAYAALTGEKTSDQALADLQAKLTELTQ